MKVANLFLAVSGFFALTAHSAPASTNNPSNDNFIGPRDRVHVTLNKRDVWCNTNETTWENRISDMSPFTKHCHRLAANIWGDGSWTFHTKDGQKRIAQYKSCAFGGTATGGGDKFVVIGNEDVRALIFGSIDRFHEFRAGVDRVQSRGVVQCLVSDPGHILDWGLYALKGSWPNPDIDGNNSESDVQFTTGGSEDEA